mgnify:CR=1 FL=1
MFDQCLFVFELNESIDSILASSIAIVLPSIQRKYPTKYPKRSTSSKTSQRKSIPKDEDKTSSNDPNEQPSLSVFSSAKVRYVENEENQEDNDNIGSFGLQIESSNNQLRYKYIGRFSNSKTIEFFNHFFLRSFVQVHTKACNRSFIFLKKPTVAMICIVSGWIVNFSKIPWPISIKSKMLLHVLVYFAI